MKLKNKNTNQVVAEEIILANSFLKRAIGLISYKTLSLNKTLWIKKCNSIHTFFMKFSIDLLFVDSHLKVRAIYKNIRPWKVVFPVWGASSVFEFANGALKNVNIGDELYVDS